MGCRRAETFSRRIGNKVASHASKMQREDTKANWTSVKVAGLSKALRMDLDEVLVKADDVYHMRQRICHKWPRLATVRRSCTQDAGSPLQKDD